MAQFAYTVFDTETGAIVAQTNSATPAYAAADARDNAAGHIHTRVNRDFSVSSDEERARLGATA